ncbi:MAG: murein biosynthesis integral membrane protein MurJ [Acidimicrobiales bacterium]
MATAADASGASEDGPGRQPPPSGATRSVLRASALPAIGTTLSRVTGLIRVGALTAALGLTTVSDIYNLSNTTPNILYELVLGGVLSSTLVPLFIRTLDDPDDDTASVVTTVSFVAISVLTMLAVLLAPLINWLFSLPLSGSELARQQEIGITFLAILLPQILFYGVTTLITALLHARRRFAPAAFAPVLTNLITAAAALVSAWVVTGPNEGSTAQVYILGFGTTLGVAAMAIVLVPYVRLSGIDLRWRFQPRHPAVKAVVRLSGWTVGFAAANQVALMIILNIARTGEAGAVSAYQYAFIFFQLPHGLVAVSLMTVVMPELAEAAVDRAEQRYRARFREGLSLILTFMIPAAIGFIAIGRPLVELLLERGNFTQQDSDNVTGMLICLAIGLPAFSTFLYTCRAFYARRDTRTPFYLNLVENAINVALALPFLHWFGPVGLGLAYSFAYCFIAVAGLAVLHRRVGRLLDLDDAHPLLRAVAVGVVVGLAMGLYVLVIGSSLDGSPVLEIVLALVVGLVAFIPTAVYLHPLGFEPVVVQVRRRLGLRHSKGSDSPGTGPV